MEDAWVGGEKEVEESVDERGIETTSNQSSQVDDWKYIPQEQDDGFHGEHDKGASEIAFNQLAQINFHLFLLGVYRPVFGASAELGRFLNQDKRRVSLVDEEVVHDGGRGR